MANLREITATSALNQDNYINKLYDKRQQSQKDIIGQDQKSSNEFLNNNAETAKNQTDEYLNRTNVEAQKAAQQPTYPRQSLSYGASAQDSISRRNQQQRDVSALTGQQAQAEAAIERRRQQLASFYQEEIQRATAENDMQRAQQLYNAAKAEEKQLQSLRQEAAAYASGMGNNSILESIARGDPVQRDTTTETISDVLKNEDAINKIYNANMQAEKLKLQQEREASMAGLEEKQLQARQQTDQQLNAAYTSALQKARNAAESQNAYGMGSGTAAQAGLAREMGLQGDLTELRRLQLGKDAQYGMDAYGILDTYNKALEKANAENELKRAQGLYTAAEDEENNLVAQQKWLAQMYAKQGDNSILERLYGLAPGTLTPASGGGGGEPGRALTGIPYLDYGRKNSSGNKTYTPGTPGRSNYYEANVSANRNTSPLIKTPYGTK